MRVLVLVLSCSKPPYDALYRTQEATWASEDVPDCPVRYYFCDDMASMTGRLRGALRAVLEEQWDFVFRTNSSSYVDRGLLLKKAETLPRERCYTGVDGGGFASGSGFFLSRDLAQALVRELPDVCPSRETGAAGGLPPDLIEDEVVGRVLAGMGVGVLPGAERVDYWTEKFMQGFYGRSDAAFEAEVRRAYHVRCKSARGDRADDVRAMKVVHEIKSR